MTILNVYEDVENTRIKLLFARGLSHFYASKIFFR